MVGQKGWPNKGGAAHSGLRPAIFVDKLAASMKNHSVSTIDEKTKIPFVWVAVAAPFVAGAILWLASIDAKASAARDNQVEDQAILRRLETKLNKIDTRLSHIEGKLEK